MEKDRFKKKKAHKKFKGTFEDQSEDSKTRADEVSEGRKTTPSKTGVDSRESADRRLQEVTSDEDNQETSDEDNQETSEAVNGDTSEEDSARDESDVQSDENDEKTSTEQEYVSLFMFT